MNIDLTKMWTDQLYKEFHHQCWYYKVKLQASLIQIEDNLTNWAEWDSLARTIRIKRALIENHSWYVVVEVLKHEMAHQYVTEHVSEHDTSHGLFFHSACERFAIEPWARTAAGRLPLTHSFNPNSQLSQEQEKILQRAKKLLQLANSSNENEAFLALKMAMDILSKHQLENHLNAEANNPQTLVLYFRKEKISRVTQRSLSILNHYFRVRLLTSTLFNPQTLRKEKIAEIVGLAHDVKFAEYIYAFLTREVESLWKKSKLSGRVQKNSYQLGILVGFEKKLDQEAQTLKHPSNSTALIHLDNAVTNFYHKKFPRIHAAQSSGTKILQSAYLSGQDAGGKIQIRRPMANSVFGGYLT